MWNGYDQITAEIAVQPHETTRFRYASEKTAGRIFGKNHTTENPTFTTITLRNYVEEAIIRVTCLTKEENRPHPHNLVKIKKDSKKEECVDGIFTVRVPANTTSVVFSNLGLQCIKRDEVQNALQKRTNHGVDPFNTGFNHHSSTIDLHSVRLCFEIFIGDITNPRKYIRLVTDPIANEKALLIYKISHPSGSVEGGLEVLMFCEKIVKADDIRIHFFEEREKEIVWSAYGTFQATDVHKQVGIAFTTPRYKDLYIEEPVDVKIQLLRRSDGSVSQSVPFQYRARDFLRKRKKSMPFNFTSNFPPPTLKLTHMDNVDKFQIRNYVNFGPSTNTNVPTTNFNTIPVMNIPNTSTNAAQEQINVFEQVFAAQNLATSSQNFNLPSTSTANEQYTFDDVHEKLEEYDSDKLLQLADEIVTANENLTRTPFNSFS